MALEDELAEMRRREAAMKEAHRNELVELQQRLRAELDQERERLLSQIRELARMNSKLPTKKLKQEVTTVDTIINWVSDQEIDYVCSFTLL